MGNKAKPRTLLGVNLGIYINILLGSTHQNIIFDRVLAGHSIQLLSPAWAWAVWLGLSGTME